MGAATGRERPVRVMRDVSGLLHEVLADPRAAELLRRKCEWECMTGAQVLNEWGDPRRWPSYRRAFDLGITPDEADAMLPSRQS